MRLDEIPRVAPITPCIQVSQLQTILQTEFDSRERAGNLARDEGFAPHRRFVVEQDSVAGERRVRFAVVDGYPAGIKLGCSVWRARTKRRGFPLGHFLNATVQFGDEAW